MAVVLEIFSRIPQNLIKTTQFFQKFCCKLVKNSLKFLNLKVLHLDLTTGQFLTGNWKWILGARIRRNQYKRLITLSAYKHFFAIFFQITSVLNKPFGIMYKLNFQLNWLTVFSNYDLSSWRHLAKQNALFTSSTRATKGERQSFLLFQKLILYSNPQIFSDFKETCTLGNRVLQDFCLGTSVKSTKTREIIFFSKPV